MQLGAFRNRGVTVPDCLPGFGHINRYWDPEHQVFAAKILPGEFYVTRGNEMIVTTLGSCVSACVRDRRLGVGGMNHFMLPVRGGDPNHWEGDPLSTATRYGNHAMEQLINRVLALGGQRQELEVKLFGGGRVLAGVTDVGKRNIEFAESYVRTEGLRLIGRDLGGQYPRKVQYFPESGRARSKKLLRTRNDTVVRREEHYLHEIDEQPVSGDVDLF
ncbi:chemoreceptor glutamine deamidase CheD [Halorhodospira halophila]|uniref:Probable chemoreceptor glutamine deamidase CheD n=1 Tax=Halorhodospira halophila (strain DSM 244 / SL1) TaxID=349124 RepID=CHED_HALHL|nr:chemoreceptor glutamine deamidase CheD [Halorhodospira halophila]A1WZ13.1 RecName: Full=Probable chemoreceptor glutamine deamidase CheD [Halorhodospira halophila SL1]ABM62925.1 CheD [Halorhodospira halophila SL1]MBK1727954.1 chemoreceptor glutamine deamidase CheD [Halorhodospira halophila]